VSWYEAAAYARFAGKALPTVYHWLTASGTGTALAKLIVPASNFGGAGPAKVGQYQSVGPCGTYDMAGNVKEWCFNSAGDDKRYILGGAWDEQEYMFTIVDSQSSFHRAPNCGFRCVQYLPSQEPAAKLFREEKRWGRDVLKEKLLSDAEFEFVKRLYAYDNQRALNARAGAYLYLPRQARPPYQTVVYWPAVTVIGKKKWTGDHEVEFLVRSGRAVVLPVYKGTLERQVGPVNGAAEAWELHKQQAIDLRRAIDYLQTRDDVDARVIGYYGVSWGALKAPWLLALEDRIKAAVLVDGGLYIGPLPDGRWGISEFQGPEQDPVHYLPRIKMPVLMLNGKYDAVFPLVDSQEPMFHLLGTPAEHKMHRLFKTSHYVPGSPSGVGGMAGREREQETLKWFDRYLGPVTAKPSSAAAAE
jgi:dienelactone hydrolase